MSLSIDEIIHMLHPRHRTGKCNREIAAEREIYEFFVEWVLPDKQKHAAEARIDTDLEHGQHIGYTDGWNGCVDYIEATLKETLNGKT